jgi:pantoate--beta-alanine ligase
MIKMKMREILEPLHVEHIEVVTRSFEPAKEIKKGDTIILVEAVVGDTRLIDNIWI